MKWPELSMDLKMFDELISQVLPKKETEERENKFQQKFDLKLAYNEFQRQEIPEKCVPTQFATYNYIEEKIEEMRANMPKGGGARQSLKLP